MRFLASGHDAIKWPGAGVEGGTGWGGYGLKASVELNKTTLKEYTRRTLSSLPRSGRRRSPLGVIIDSIIVRSSTTYDVRMIITIATIIPSTTQGA